MSLLNITLPDSLFRRVESMAKEDGVSVDAFVAAVLSQRVAVADADSYVKERARRGSAQGMLDVLREAPDVEPDGEDKMGQAVGGA